MTTYDFVSANKRKTWMLIAIVTALVMAVAWVADRAYGAGGTLLFIGGAYSLTSALVGFYAGDKVALASSGARAVTSQDAPQLWRVVENLCIAQGMPMPKVHIMHDDAINAFATGRDPEHASIAVTTGALRKLDEQELQGVIAHELSHIQNYDIRVMTIVIVLVGIVGVMANMFMRFGIFGGRSRDDRRGGGIVLIVGLVLAILAPIVAQLIQLAVSRRREYLADASGALMTRYPDGLARALLKIEQDARPMASASSATAHLFIANPFKGKSMAALLSTHPPIADRVARLREMGA